MLFHLQFKITILTVIIILLLFHGCSKEVGAWSTAPDFALTDLAGNKISLKQFRGNIILLDFWATWCPPCRISIPELVNMQEKYRDRGVVILGISVDDPQMYDDNYLFAFKTHFKINYKILRGNGKVARDYFGAVKIALPTLFVIDREGKIVDKHVGFVPGIVEKSLQKILE